MAWIDFETGRPYTDKEVERLKAARPATVESSAQTAPEAAPTAAEPRPVSDDGLSNFGTGVEASLRKTYLGLKQLGTYLTGNPEAREAVNRQIEQMEAEYGPILDTTAGKAGEVVGTVGQFLVPGMGAARVGKLIPGAVEGAAKLFGQAGGIRRAATTAGAFEGAQPVTPGNTRTEDFLIQRGGRALLGTAAGGGVGAVASRVTRAGVPQAPALTGVEKEAERVGLTGDAALTPAQRTGDPTLLQLEEGLLSKEGSSGVIRSRRNAQQDVLNTSVSKALGYPKMAPTESAFGMARDNANLAYEPIAQIPKMAPDVKYFDALTKFSKKQATKATGSKDAGEVADRLQRGSGKITGEGFLEELQGVRDMAFGASKKGDVATSKNLKELAGIMEDFLERRLERLAKQSGNTITTDTLKEYQNARLQHAVIRSLEKATDPVLGKVSPNKILQGQFARQRPGSTASPTTQALQEVTDIARVLRKVAPYIGSSGTAERLGGQHMVEASTSPLSALRLAGPMLKNYLAAKLYLRYGGQPGMLGGHLTPGQNAFIRRMLPPEAIGAGEAMAD